MEKIGVFEFLMKNNQQDTCLFLDKHSFDNLKKTNQNNQCHSKDFQPFLEYSPWHLFEQVIERIIKGCKNSLHFSFHSITEHHRLTKEWEDSLPKILSKNAGFKFERHVKMPRVKALKEENDPLHELFSHRRNYSIFKD